MSAPRVDWRPLPRAERDALLPLVLPADWRRERDFSVMAVFRRADGLLVMVSLAEHLAEPVYDVIIHAAWLHVSTSRKDRLPSWEDLRDVKNLFVGLDRRAIQILPPQAEYVNMHPNVLHLWAPVGHEPLPDFRDAKGGI